MMNPHSSILTDGCTKLLRFIRQVVLEIAGCLTSKCVLVLCIAAGTRLEIITLPGYVRFPGLH